MTTQQSSYRQIMKATSLFGGVQVFNILIGIIRSKFIAVLLGPFGIGISGLLQSTTSLISGMTAMGLSTSAVKSISEANNTGNIKRISFVVTAFRKLTWITGSLGMIITIILSPFLSKWTFGNYDFTFSFLILSITLLFQQISSGQGVLMQGMRRINHLAKSGVIGSTIGLFVTIPIYFFYGIKGIVPTLVISSITTLMLTWYFSKKIKIEEVKVDIKTSLVEGKEMLKMGIVMTLNSIMVLGSAYILRSYISRTDGLEKVGLFQAGFAIVNTYTGMIFSAMTTDYYPRLAAVNNDNKKCKEIVNQQAEIAILIMSPLLLIFLVFMPLIISILYSNKFLGSTGYMQWAILGILFKISSWAIAYQFIAKSDTKIFIVNEVIANFYTLVFNILGYKLLGLDGLGISFSLSFLVYSIQVYLVAKKRYNFGFSKSFNLIYWSQLFLFFLCFFSIRYLTLYLSYTVGIILIIISSVFVLVQLNKKIGLSSILNKFLRKR